MGKITLTRDLIWAVAQDEGNRSMRQAGREAWNEDDYNIACKKFNELDKILEREWRKNMQRN